MKYAVIIGFLLLLLGGFWYVKTSLAPNVVGTPKYSGTEINATSTEEAPLVEVITENLNIPWEVVFLPDGEILVTERPGSVLLLKQGIKIPIEGIMHAGEGGLLGATLHPDFAENNFVYLYQTTDTASGVRNQINRYILKEETLTFERTIVGDLPGARYHDGGRIVFGPDGYLYVTLGDAGNEADAQNTAMVAGSILRFTDEGEVPFDNPFQNPVYSYGHRNPQGLAWDDAQNLWSTEHGRSGVFSGFDELNLITVGENYGWPEIQGDESREGMKTPIRHSGASTTWAPASLVYLDGSLYFAGLRGETLYEVVIEDTNVVAWYEHFVGTYGRLRTVAVGPDGSLYLTTSNQDGRGKPKSNDDRIIRINPKLLER